jgi:hypothetical protein
VSLFIETVDGIRYDLSEYGLIPLKLEIDSLSPKTESESTDGQDGHIDLETTYDGRTMRASFLMSSNDIVDYSTKRDNVFRLFNGKTYFYLLDNRVPFKRWKVRSATVFNLEKVNRRKATFEIACISSSPYAESTGSTLNPGWHFQVSAPEEVLYTFNDPTFKIWNDGDSIVDPREHFLKIAFKGLSNNLTIKNLTTGDEWVYSGPTIANDQIELTGIRSLKNGTSIFGQTNKKLITLLPGWNQFQIFGAVAPFEISFDFRFLYI